MTGYGEPDWATPGATTAAVTQEATGGAIAAPTSGSSDTRSRLTLASMSFVDIGLAAMMGTLGVFVLMDFNYTNLSEASEAFLASYMLLFAVLLFLYELMWWMGIPWMNKSIRKNFGFMYGLKGKGLYLVFVAFLCLGLKNDNSSRNKTLAWATGIAYLVVGCLHLFVVCVHPDINELYRPPTAGLENNNNNGDHVV